MNIVHVPRRFVREEWGGTETVILETCRELGRRGHRVQVFCPNALAATDREEIGGVPVRRFPYFYPYWGLSADARAALDKKAGSMFSFSLLRALRKEPGLELIHLHTLKRVGGIGRLAARRRGIPYVATLHGGVHDVPAAEAAEWTEPARGAFEWGKLLGWWVGSRRVLADAAAILCVGAEEARRTAERYPGRRVLHLPNGVDAGRFAGGDGDAFRRRHGIGREEKVLLNVGRIDPQKNQLFALRLLRELHRERGGGVRLVLVGPATSPGYREEVLAAAGEWGLTDALTLLPGLPPDSGALADAYHAADLFVLPSRHEPFGIVALEAWAAGRAVLAARVGGIPSFVEDGRDGLLFPPDDLPEALAGARALLDDPARAGALAAAGRAKAAGAYSWESVTARLEALYREVAAP